MMLGVGLLVANHVNDSAGRMAMTLCVVVLGEVAR